MSRHTIRILEPGDEALVEEFLGVQIESSMFLLGNMRSSGLTDSGQPYEGTYAAKFDGEAIVGVVAHFWNGNLIFQAPGNEAVLVRAAVEASQRPVAGLIGPNDQVLTAKRSLVIPESVVQMDGKEQLYNMELSNVIVPEKLASGEVTGRRAEAEDLELLTVWGAAYDVEALGAEESDALAKGNRASAERLLKERRTWILECDGERVACSSFNTAIEEAVQIGGVWTPPEHRRQGIGRCVVAASLLDARAEGVQKAVLFTDEGNIGARRAYEAIGFRQGGDYRLMLLGSGVKAG